MRDRVADQLRAARGLIDDAAGDLDAGPGLDPADAAGASPEQAGTLDDDPAGAPSPAPRTQPNGRTKHAARVR